MINYETILSSYDDKLTLMQWLKKVEAALAGAALASVSVSQPTETTAVLTFHFADGTTISSPSLNLPRGLQGEQGPQGPQGEKGDKGEKGEQGESGNVLYKHSMTIRLTNGSATKEVPISFIANFNNTNWEYNSIRNAIGISGGFSQDWRLSAIQFFSSSLIGFLKQFDYYYLYIGIVGIIKDLNGETWSISSDQSGMLVDAVNTL